MNTDHQLPCFRGRKCLSGAARMKLTHMSVQCTETSYTSIRVLSAHPTTGQ